MLASVLSEVTASTILSEVPPALPDPLELSIGRTVSTVPGRIVYYKSCTMSDLTLRARKGVDRHLEVTRPYFIHAPLQDRVCMGDCTGEQVSASAATKPMAYNSTCVPSSAGAHVYPMSPAEHVWTLATSL
jgi:hypothetical protein